WPLGAFSFIRAVMIAESTGSAPGGKLHVTCCPSSSIVPPSADTDGETVHSGPDDDGFKAPAWISEPAPPSSGLVGTSEQLAEKRVPSRATRLRTLRLESARFRRLRAA